LPFETQDVSYPTAHGDDSLAMNSANDLEEHTRIIDAMPRTIKTRALGNGMGRTAGL
jgi:hypothetical protein